MEISFVRYFRTRQFFRILLLATCLLAVISILFSLPTITKRKLAVINGNQLSGGIEFSPAERSLETRNREYSQEIGNAENEVKKEDVDYDDGENGDGGNTNDEQNEQKIDTCKWAKVNPEEILISNELWQVQETSEETYYLFGAYLDLREENEDQEDMPPTSPYTVRILGMSTGQAMGLQDSSLKQCLFWNDNMEESPEIGKIVDFRYLWNQQWGAGQYYPYLITCEFPSSLAYNSLTSLSLAPEGDDEKACSKITNNLGIMHLELMNDEGFKSAANSEIDSFGVCVKSLDFPEDGNDNNNSSNDYNQISATRLAEWIELQRLLGAEKILLYEFFLNSEIKKLLDYYETSDKAGVVQVMRTTLPGHLPNEHDERRKFFQKHQGDKRMIEVIQHNDCLYRLMYKYKYLAIIDTDEVILPVEATSSSWSDLLATVNELDINPKLLRLGPITTYCFQNYYFLDGMADESEVVEEAMQGFHILSHLHRSRNSTGMLYMKCFHHTGNTLAVHNHFPFWCREDHCQRHDVDVDRARLNHYRNSCPLEIETECENEHKRFVEEDVTVLRWKDELVERVNQALDVIREDAVDAY